MSDRVARLQELVAAEAAVATVDLPGPQALADAAGLLRVASDLQRVLLARLGDVDVRGLAVQHGAPTTASWLRAQDLDVPVASLATARRLVQHPVLGAAVAEGRLSPRAAEQVGRTLAQVRPHLDRPDGLLDGQDAQPVLAAVVADGVPDLLAEAFGGPADGSAAAAVLDELAQELSEIAWQVQTSQLDRLERALVLLATHLPAAFLPSALARLVGALVPTRLEDAAERRCRDRRLSLTPLPEGGGLVSGQLTSEAFELLHTALTAAVATDPANPTDTSAHAQAREDGWQPGDPPPALARSRPQRLHDALVLGLRALLDSAALGRRGKAAPHIGVTVPLAALGGAPGALPARGDSGQLLPLSLVREWLQDAWVTRFVLDLRHRVVESSHRERTLKAHERRIKAVETGFACQAATCRYGPHPPPGVRLVPHHPDAWARTGTTSVDDTAVLCEHDHDLLHRGATLQLRDGRRLDANGWVSPRR